MRFTPQHTLPPAPGLGGGICGREDYSVKAQFNGQRQGGVSGGRPASPLDP